MTSFKKPYRTKEEVIARELTGIIHDLKSCEYEISSDFNSPEWDKTLTRLKEIVEDDLKDTPLVSIKDFLPFKQRININYLSSYKKELLKSIANRLVSILWRLQALAQCLKLQPDIFELYHQLDWR